MGLKLRTRKKHRRRAQRLIRAGDRTMTFVDDADDARDGVDVPSMDEVNAALAQVPEDLNWDWASRRLIPLFERGYAEGVSGDPMVNSVTHLGVGVGYGIDFGPCVGRLTRSMAQRWEASLEQIEHAAFAHLAEVAAGVVSGDLQSVVHQGHFFRVLGQPEGWASSVVLAGDAELIRIFGVRDAVFTAPARHCLVAFAPGTPARVVAELTVQLESMEPHPLVLDPFILEDGRLRWDGLADEEPMELV
jgi:hypothetical protein